MTQFTAKLVLISTLKSTKHSLILFGKSQQRNSFMENFYLFLLHTSRVYPTENVFKFYFIKNDQKKAVYAELFFMQNALFDSDFYEFQNFVITKRARGNSYQALCFVEKYSWTTVFILFFQGNGFLFFFIKIFHERI